MAHYFTRAEAEALLPELTLILLQLQDHRVQMQAVEEELEAMQIKAMGNGHHMQDQIARLQQAIIAHIEQLREDIEQVQRFGCELKDPDTGLVDFLSLRDGREVYLCWRLGEERIAYWHPLDTGFAGRQALD